ncbi:MAG: UDP-glucose 4-epimerase GalE [Bdellovibrionales bacterium]
MRILVTGGAGYIGSHFCKWAKKANHDVIVYDNLSTGHKKFVKFGPLVEADIRDETKVLAAIKTHNIEAVVHFAAKSLVGESMKEPDLYFDNNVRGTHTLLQAIKQSDVKHLVFSSSAAVYGAPMEQPIREQTPKSPVNPYGQSKLECERLIEKSAKENNYKAIALRYFNVIGQDEEGELWESHEPETHLVPNLLKAFKARREFSIFGNDYGTMDGTCVRDYVDVNDLAMVHLEALEMLERSAQSWTVSNVGQGRGYSVKEILEAFAKTIGPVQVKMAERRPGDPDVLISDVTYFKSWYPHDLKPLSESLKSLKGL